MNHESFVSSHVLCQTKQFTVDYSIYDWMYMHYEAAVPEFMNLPTQTAGQKCCISKLHQHSVEAPSAVFLLHDYSGTNI